MVSHPETVSDSPIGLDQESGCDTWALVSWSFDKLCEVGVSSYLFYTLFKCYMMFRLV